MTVKGEKTLEEILSQPAIWAKTLEVFKLKVPEIESFWQENNFDRVIFIGCGSTYYLSQTAAVIFAKYSGISSTAYPGSEISLFSDIYLEPTEKTLLVAISRSGETSETIRAMQLFREGGFGKILAITTVPDSGVTRLADLSLIADAAQETSIAQTRSFASMLLLVEAFTLQISQQDAIGQLASFPEKIAQLLTDYQPLAKKIGEEKSIERMFFLGSAYNYGIASEAMLKMKEMSLSNSEAFHTLEFRHGPKSMVNEESLVIGLLAGSAEYQEIPVLEEMASLKGKILSLAEKKSPQLESLGEVVEINSGVSEPLRALLFLPVLQLLAYYRAISRDQNPDKPHNLDAVVQIPSMEKQGNSGIDPSE